MSSDGHYLKQDLEAKTWYLLQKTCTTDENILHEHTPQTYSMNRECILYPLLLRQQSKAIPKLFCPMSNTEHWQPLAVSWSVALPPISQPGVMSLIHSCTKTRTASRRATFNHAWLAIAQTLCHPTVDKTALLEQVKNSSLPPDVIFSWPDVARVDTKLSPAFNVTIVD